MESFKYPGTLVEKVLNLSREMARENEVLASISECSSKARAMDFYQKRIG